MKTSEIIDALEKFNKWRRADDNIAMPSPELSGIAIDEAIDKLKTIENEKET